MKREFRIRLENCSEEIKFFSNYAFKTVPVLTLDFVLIFICSVVVMLAFLKVVGLYIPVSVQCRTNRPGLCVQERSRSFPGCRRYQFGAM